MLTFKERSDSWNAMMLSPSKTIAAHLRRKELGFRDGLENFGTPIIMTYFPLMLFALILSGKLEPVYLAAVLFSLAATALGIFLISILFTSIAFFIASLLGGKAKFGRLYYMVSLVAAPTFVFTIVINLAMLLAKSILAAISFSLSNFSLLNIAGSAFAVAVTFYGFYLLTLAISALYRFSRGKSVATWLAPTAILMLAGVFLFATVLLDLLRFLIKTL
ncbi:MAG: YIP1 family protein [Candidatus Micrarchaeota archaeon]|nr:YIP1 family protein [Candidatus Micrarchaeota archaeon]